MKKLLLSFTALLFSASVLLADVVEKTYHFSAPTVSEADGYQMIRFDNTLLTGLAGAPALPYRAVALLLPPGQAAQQIRIIPSGEVTLEGTYQIYPQQHARPTSEGPSGTFVKNAAVYQRDAAYPEILNGQLTTQFQNGYSVALSSFTPVQYNPVTGRVTYYTQVTVEVVTAPDRRAEAALQNLKASAPVMQRLNKLVQNSAAVQQYPQPQQRSDDYDMIIITPTQFADDFQQLADFYGPRGMETHIVTTDDIYSNMTGQDNQEKIRNYIIQEYQEHGIQHVTLGGDVELVPYRGLYCTVQSSSVYEDDDIPSDLYYSGLDGTWNDNGNNLWGEIGEDDLLPEIGVGRFSVNSQDEFDALMHKTLSYQENPVLGELHNPFLVGEWLYSDPETYGADYLELLIGYQNENGYETTGIPEDQDIETLFERDQSWSASTLMQKMNEGHSFIHHVGHANSGYTMKFYNSDITNSNFSQLNGTTHNYTLIFSHGCDCGAFDDNDCIAERMIDIDNLAVAVMMNSRYGWFNEGQTEGPGAHLNREFVDALYDQKENHIGMAYSLCRIETAPWVTAPGQWEEGALRWNFYDLNVLGDAGISIWTDEPVDITAQYQDALPIGVPSLAVSVSGSGPVENLTCVFVKDGVTYGKAQTDASGQAEIVFSEPITELGDATLYISGYNCQLHEYPVTVIPNTGAYVVYASSEINDVNGNNNGIPEYTESILLTTTLENVGTVQADNVTATLSSDDPYVTITDDSEDFGSIPGEETVTVADAFGFDIAGNVPDQHPIAFNIEAVGDDSWSSGFSVTANAPALAMDGFYFDDAATGNNNGILDPGETADMIITAANNGHASAYEVSALLSSSDPYITVNTTGAQDLGDLSQASTVDAVFSVTADAETPAGYAADLSIHFEAMYGIAIDEGLVVDFSDYCYPTGNCSYSDGLTGFALETIDNMDNGCSNSNGIDGYGDFTDMSAVLEPGQTYTISWETGYSDQNASLWIDFNSNKEFEDSERLISDFNLANAGQVYTQDITIPEDVTGGIKRLRVRAHWQESSVNPCEDYSYGETEDYTVEIAVSTLAVQVTCNPEEICQGGSAQMLAMPSGGTGNYTYLWTPSTGLSDPTIYNPVASPDETTTYTVDVNDGNTTVSTSAEVVVHELPVTPVITQIENTLFSDAEEGNQWYDSEGAIPGATDPEFTPEAEDDYYVIVTSTFGCESEPSNVIHVTITGIADPAGSSRLGVFPNPFNEKVNIEFAVGQGQSYNLAVYNALGQQVKLIAKGISSSDRTQKFEISAAGLEKGIYFCKLITGDQVLIRKMIHND